MSEQNRRALMCLSHVIDKFVMTLEAQKLSGWCGVPITDFQELIDSILDDKPDSTILGARLICQDFEKWLDRHKGRRNTEHHEMNSRGVDDPRTSEQPL